MKKIIHNVGSPHILYRVLPGYQGGAMCPPFAGVCVADAAATFQSVLLNAVYQLTS